MATVPTYHTFIAAPFGATPIQDVRCMQHGSQLSLVPRCPLEGGCRRAQEGLGDRMQHNLEDTHL